jgi:hypothetical protein
MKKIKVIFQTEILSFPENGGIDDAGDNSSLLFL